MASIYDIAKIAGVSAMTVSNVLNNKGRFSDKTRDRVLRIAAEQGYELNVNARSLRERRTYTVGIITPNVSNDYFSTIVLEMEKALHNRGYSSFICNTAYDGSRCESYLTELRRRNVDGIAVVGTPSLQTGELIGNIPCTFVDYYGPLRTKNCCLIASDLLALTADQLACLESHGCSSTALIVPIAHESDYLDAVRSSFTAKLAEHSLREHPYSCLNDPALTLLVSNDMYASPKDFVATIKQALAKQPQINGIATIGDRMAMLVCDAVKEMGRTPGNDILIIGSDNSIYSSVHTPNISTVDRNRHLMARAATGALLAMMEGKEPAERSITIPHRIIERETTLGAN